MLVLTNHNTVRVAQPKPLSFEDGCEACGSEISPKWAHHHPGTTLCQRCADLRVERYCAPIDGEGTVEHLITRAQRRIGCQRMLGNLSYSDGAQW